MTEPVTTITAPPGRLLKSTLLALLVAAVLLVTVVLPAEHGIDPTGAGRVLGLTEMGEIKRSLAQEAEASHPAPVLAPEPSAPAAAPNASPAQ